MFTVCFRLLWIVALTGSAFTGMACTPQFDRYGLGGVRFVLNRPIETSVERKQRSQSKCDGQVFVPLPHEGEDEVLHLTHEMNFEAETYDVELAVSQYLYRATLGSLEKCAFDDFDALSEYYRNRTAQPAMISFYEAILTPLRKIRTARGYDDSMYARLLIRFVQSFGYCEQLTGNPKAPIATVVEGCGDCDEKSVLLAGLLAHEGFDVSLLTFWNHMAVGIRSEEEGYSGTDYLYVESTNVTRPGLAEQSVRMELELDPIVVGTGTKLFKRSETDKRLSQLYLKALSELKDYRDDIDEESAIRFKGIELSLRDTESVKKSIRATAKSLSPSELMYLTYSSILMYITYSPHAEADVEAWVNEIMDWAKYLESEHPAVKR